MIYEKALATGPSGPLAQRFGFAQGRCNIPYKNALLFYFI